MNQYMDIFLRPTMLKLTLYIKREK